MSARDGSQADASAHPRRPIARILTVWLSSTATLVLLSALLSGIEVDSFGAALGAAALIGMLNALLWPLILRFALPLTVLTLGLGAVILNGAIVLLASAVDVGLKVSSLSAAIVTTVAITIVSTAVSSALAIDDDGFWYRHVLGRYGKRRAPPQELESPGLLFLEIDGLAHDVLLRAIRDGNAPTMARWVQTGSHRLARWETDWSSQTGACQAGLLHGNN